MDRPNLTCFLCSALLAGPPDKVAVTLCWDDGTPSTVIWPSYNQLQMLTSLVRELFTYQRLIKHGLEAIALLREDLVKGPVTTEALETLQTVTEGLGRDRQCLDQVWNTLIADIVRVREYQNS